MTVVTGGYKVETFMGMPKASTFPLGSNEIGIIGICSDAGVTNVSGASKAPDAIRKASGLLIDGDNPRARNNLRNHNIFDIGNILPNEYHDNLNEVYKLMEYYYDNFLKNGAFPVTLGGDHSITLPVLRSIARKHGPVSLIHFDAHHDTWTENFGNPYTHGTVFYHAVNEGLINPEKSVQIGIRSAVPVEVIDWTLNQGFKVYSAIDVHENKISDIVKEIKQRVGNKVYLSFDIDAIDPSQAPGTGTPEAGGLFTHQAISFLSKFNDINFVGMDLVEVSPTVESNITPLLGATIVWEFLSHYVK